MTKFQTALSFDDVLLVPKMSHIPSRKDIDLTSRIRDTFYKLPIISSPMDTVTESAMATCMDKLGGLGIVHRYNSIEEQVKIIQESVSLGSSNVGAAIGVSGDFEERATALCDAGAKVICLDIAHGHHEMMGRAISRLRNILPSSVSIVAGNVATLEGFDSLADAGADAVRVGVGGLSLIHI